MTNDNEMGHVVLVREKTKILLREQHPSYGAAMWAVLKYEELYPESIVEYRDIRSFFVDREQS